MNNMLWLAAGRGLFRTMICVAFVAGTLLARGALSTLPREDFWVPDGPVNAVVVTNGIVYVGGAFDYVSPVSPVGRALDSESGAELPGFPRVVGTIRVIQSDGLGGWFVGGRFTSIGGVQIGNLAHVLPDFSVDENWGGSADGEVRALVLGDGVLYVGGSFTEVSGTEQTNLNLKALDAITGAVTDWEVAITSDTGPAYVNALTLSAGTLFVGGRFTHINNVQRAQVAAVDAGTGVVADWHPNASTGGEAFSEINALALSGKTLFVGGNFSTLGGANNDAGLPRRALAALDITRTNFESVTTWDAHADAAAIVHSLVVSCDTVFVGGSFSEIGGQPRKGLAALDIHTGLAKPWAPVPNGEVLSLSLAGNSIYAAGKFTEIDGRPRGFIAAIDADSGQVTPWQAQADYATRGMSISHGVVIAGGAFGPGGKFRQNLAAFDVRTGELLDWAPAVSGGTLVNLLPRRGVNTIAVDGDQIFLGGLFTEINGVPRNRLAAINTATGEVSPWNPNADGPVKTIALTPDRVYVGGSFTALKNKSRARLGAVDRKKGAVKAWNPSADDKVETIAVSGNSIYVGGRFTRIGNRPRNRIAAFTPTSNIATEWRPDANDTVSVLALNEDDLFIGGRFTLFGGELMNRLTVLTVSTPAPGCWQPEISEPESGPGNISALAFSADRLYAAGGLIAEAGDGRVGRNTVVELWTECPGDVAGWIANIEGGSLSTSVNALATTTDSLLVGGDFVTVAGEYRPSLALFAPEGAPRIVEHPVGADIPKNASLTLQIAAEGEEPLSYQWQMNGTNIGGADQPTNTIASAQPADSGLYTVIVTNALGFTRSHSARVTVTEPIQIISSPVSQVVTPGTTVTLQVVAAGNPPPGYQWRLNGVNIPGAIAASLVISNAQPTNGGSYSVVIANSFEAMESDVANITVTSGFLPFTDNLNPHIALGSASGVGRGSNVGATNEPGEPRHANKPGGASVWLGWRAPDNGIATFTTRGSSFDTLLAVYTGMQVDDLAGGEVTSDEDRGDFFTSRVSFNAVAGTEYLIAVDGFHGATGDIVLSWDLDRSVVDFPRIINQPQSVSVTAGESATFAVDVDQAAVTYQWFLNCQSIEGATDATLEISNVSISDVGNYRVQVINSANRFTESVAAALELGPEPSIVSQDKLEDIAPETPGADLRKQTVGSLVARFGTIGSQTLNNFGATTSKGETNHCRRLGGASKWLSLEPETNGWIEVDTVGSRIDTVLAVYLGRRTRGLEFVTCDDNSAPDGIRSLVRFEARQGTNYSVVVDGARRARGAIKMNWRLVAPPSIHLSSTAQSMPPDGIAAKLLSTSEGTGLRVMGMIHPGWVLEGTTDFEAWQPIWTNTSSTVAPLNFLERDVTARPWRFYRTVPLR